MTLVDTSVWISHFRKPNSPLTQLLADGEAGIHPFIVGELALGSFKGISTSLRRLPQVAIASETEVCYLLETHRLWSTGLGWIDLHLLTAAAVAGWRLMTADAVLEKAARKVGIAH